MRRASTSSRLLHKSIQHPLLAGAVEVDGELVAFDGGDVAVAELHVEDAVADRETRGFGGRRFRHQLAVDRAAARAAFAVADALDRVAGAGAPVVSGGVGAVLLGALPAGRGVVVLEGISLVEARLAVAATTIAAIGLFILGHVHMGERQLLEEA